MLSDTESRFTQPFPTNWQTGVFEVKTAIKTRFSGFGLNFFVLASISSYLLVKTWNRKDGFVVFTGFSKFLIPMGVIFCRPNHRGDRWRKTKQGFAPRNFFDLPP